MALVYALTLASQVGWSGSSTLISLGVSIVLLAAFLFNESRVKYPLMPLSIFRRRNVSGGNLVMLPVVAGARGEFFLLSLFFQDKVAHFPPPCVVRLSPIPNLSPVLY